LLSRRAAIALFYAARAWLKLPLLKPVQLLRICSVAIHSNRPKNS
jgi:hypothetical protein